MFGKFINNIVKKTKTANNKLTPKSDKLQETIELQRTEDFIVQKKEIKNLEIKKEKTFEEAAEKELEKAKKEIKAQAMESTSLAEEIATIYSEGEVSSAFNKLSEFINNNKGNVNQRFWYMLLDLHQNNNDRQNFDKTALAFSHKFETSPPSWYSNEVEEEENAVASGKNLLMLEQHLRSSHIEKFKAFLKESRNEKFCRINLSQTKFEQSDFDGLKALHKLFKDLRKYKVLSVLMGENNLINLCKNYINCDVNNKTLNEEFINNEEFFWLLLLEILQWKGKQEEFENLALEYAMKFDTSPPGWENEGVMTIETTIRKSTQESEVDNTIKIDNIITVSNCDSLLNIIQNEIENKSKCEIDFSNVQRIDFSSVGSISFFIQDILSKENFKNKKVVFKNLNELILVLLEMIGVTEFVTIEQKKR